MSDNQLASLILAGPCLALCGLWLIGLAFTFRPARVVIRKQEPR